MVALRPVAEAVDDPEEAERVRTQEVAADVQAAKKDGIKYFLISFVDLFGVLRAKLVPAPAIREMAKAGAGFAGAWLALTLGEIVTVIWILYSVIRGWMALKYGRAMNG